MAVPGDNTYQAAFIDLFAKNFTLEVQQKADRLAGQCEIDRWKGRRKRYNFQNEIDYVARTKPDYTIDSGGAGTGTMSPSAPTVNEYTFRFMHTAAFKAAKWWDIDDEFDAGDIANPKGATLRSFMAGYNRLLEKTKIGDPSVDKGGGLLGEAVNSVDGETEDGGTLLPAGQTVAVGYTQPGTPDVAGNGLTVDKIREAKRIFDANEVDPDQEKIFVVGPSQLQDMLGTMEITSSDYASVKALVDGRVDTFCGFKFIMSTRLPTDGGTPAIRSAVAYCKEGLVMNPGYLQTRFDELPEMDYTRQLWSMARLGAMRSQDKLVVEVLCQEV